MLGDEGIQHFSSYCSLDSGSYTNDFGQAYITPGITGFERGYLDVCVEVPSPGRPLSVPPTHRNTDAFSLSGSSLPFLSTSK
ncbi:hypothetical protein K474DRAFT_1652667, partial [Panus rudis PR-1116 ss-1]